MNIYIDETTGELIIIRGTTTTAIPAYTEVYREKDTDGDILRIKSVHSRYDVLPSIVATDAQDATGTPYASLQAMWSALDTYFDATA